MAQLAATVEALGHSTFLPQRDGLEGLAMRLAALPGARSAVAAPVDRWLRRAIFALDVFELVERCDAVVWNLNGRVPDEGAVVEATLAFAIGKPLVGYKDDARSVFEGHDNPMLTGLLDERAVARTVRDVPRALAHALAAGGHPSGARAPALDATLALGRKVARLLEAAPALRLESEVAPSLIEALRRLSEPG